MNHRIHISSPALLRATLAVAALLLCCGAPASAATFGSPPAAGQGAGPSRPVPAFEWLAAALKPDTFLHAYGGAMSAFLVTSFAMHFYSASTIRNYPLLLPAIGLSSALTAGIAKETLDSTGFGDPQWSDIIHTIVGGMLAAGAIAAIELSASGQSGSLRYGSEVLAGAGFSLAVPIAAGLAEEVVLYLKRRSGK